MKHKKLQKNLEQYVHQIFGYNSNLELRYRGRMKLKDLRPIGSGKSDLFSAMKLISESGKGPKEQIPYGCNIKWFS